MRVLWPTLILILASPALAAGPASSASGRSCNPRASGDDPNPYPSGQQFYVAAAGSAGMLPTPDGPTIAGMALASDERSSDGSAARRAGGDDPNPNPIGSDNPDRTAGRSIAGDRGDLPVAREGGDDANPSLDAHPLRRADGTSVALTAPPRNAPPGVVQGTGHSRDGAGEAALIFSASGRSAVWVIWSESGDGQRAGTIAHVVHGTVVDVFTVPGLTDREAAWVAQRLLFENGRARSQN